MISAPSCDAKEIHSLRGTVCANEVFIQLLDSKVNQEQNVTETTDALKGQSSPTEVCLLSAKVHDLLLIALWFYYNTSYVLCIQEASKQAMIGQWPDADGAEMGTQAR